MTITIADGRGALWQWDTGRRVKITDGADVKQIHYQNRCFGCSVDVDVGADGTAIIPDELLQDYHTLTAYAYVTDDTGAYTMVQQDFAVYKRAKPADYVYTPTEHAGFDRLQRQIGNLSDLTTGAHDTLVAAINEVALMGGRMSLRMADGYIQYSTDGGSTWTNLIAVSDLKGGKGDPGTPGKDGHSPVVTATKSGKTTTISVDGAAIATVEDGVDGDPGKDGAGMDITGATVGQIAKITAVDASGVPTAWSPADMPEQVQPDWNQNDSTALDYVKNRPFYTGGPVETVLVEESTVPFTENRGRYIGQLESTFSATVGETYKVSWDGTTYECACVDFMGIAAIGNLSITGAGSDTGEPFVMNADNGQEIFILTADTSASHTLSISGIVVPIVKIPAKYIDKGASGYIVVHNSSTMTEEEAKNYVSAISKGEAVFIIWNDICIKFIQFNEIDNNILLITQNDETYLIEKNNDGLFAFSDRKFYNASFPSSLNVGDEVTEIYANRKKIVISSSKISSGVGSTDVLFKVDPNGVKSKAFDVLGNGEAVMPALILYSSTADSTKKFKITVDDSGTISAMEVT